MINCDQNKCVSLVKTGKTFSIYLKANVQANPTKCAQHFICKTIFYGKRFISASSPKNIEFESILTFKGEANGSHITSVAPSDDAVTVIQHQSFIALPDSGYKPRVFHPYSGFNN